MKEIDRDLSQIFEYYEYYYENSNNEFFEYLDYTLSECLYNLLRKEIIFQMDNIK